MHSKKATTIKEIARELKVSPSTVSRALNDHPSIGAVTVMRIKKLAKELNYEPNQTAIFFKQRKTFTIGVILPKISEPFFSQAISDIESLAESKDYTVLLGQSLDDPQRELEIIKTFKKHRVDGIIISLGKNTQNFDFIETLRIAQIPIVFFDCVPDRDDVHRVWCELETGMSEAIKELVSRGLQKIGLINGPKNLLASVQRQNSFLLAHEEQNIPILKELITNTDLTKEGNEKAFQYLFDLEKKPSAIVCFNDYVTLDFIRYAKKHNIVINQDVYLVSYANYSIWQYLDNPPLGNIEQYPGEQAQKATNILFEQISSKTLLAPQNVIFASKLTLT